MFLFFNNHLMDMDTNWGNNKRQTTGSVVPSRRFKRFKTTTDEAQGTQSLDKQVSSENFNREESSSRDTHSKDSTTSCVDHTTTLSQISCGGYVFYMSDGSTFPRRDVETVAFARSVRLQSRLAYSKPFLERVKKNMSDDEEENRLSQDNYDETSFVHVCQEDYMVSNMHNQILPTSSNTVLEVQPTNLGRENKSRFLVSNKCNAWPLLSATQQNVLTRIQERVDEDRARNRYFTCAILEGPGGCGKTRLMSHVMNHKQKNTLVMYVTKQNKRVQDFIHTDCLNGEVDMTVQKPTDLTPLHADDIIGKIVNNTGGRFALTANKLVYALCRKRPTDFNQHNTLESLGIHENIFVPKNETVNDQADHVASFDNEERKKSNTLQNTSERNIIILMDEYTMHEPPLIHTIAHYMIQITGLPLVLIMGGDKLQCGPIGWEELTKEKIQDETHFTNDVRHEIFVKMGYSPLDIRMENLERCREDTALIGCVKRLRRICEGSTNARVGRPVLNMVLARYSVEAGVDLYRQIILQNGVSTIRKIVPSDLEDLDFSGRGFQIPYDKNSGYTNTESRSIETNTNLLDEEEYDERGVQFVLSNQPPVAPMYDLLPLVNHFTKLYIKLAEISFQNLEKSRWQAAKIINKSVAEIRNLFPLFIVLTNESCNVFAEIFILALYTQVRERVLNAPVPDSLVRKILRKETWTGHLNYTLRKYVRSLAIDKEDVVQRQTLFVGMIYKMTSTFKTDALSLCNGETVVLTAIVFNNNTLDTIEGVVLRKLDRDINTDLKLKSGQNKNRMTKDKGADVMPFVPHISENIYQMQGNTMPKSAMCFIDLVNAPPKNVYVAVSRFQNSRSIKGIVISDDGK